MRLAIMQPYFFPYIGYFQLIAAVDRFVILDDVNYINRGWVNRNRILVNGAPSWITVPLHQASQNRLINQIEISQGIDWQSKLLRTLECAYRRAPFYADIMPLLQRVITYPEKALSPFLLHGITQVAEYLDIRTPVVPSSAVYGNKTLKGWERLADICQKEQADEYVNPQGGTELYSAEQFAEHGIQLHFLYSKNQPYPQFGKLFQPWLSVADVLMFNGRETIQVLKCYELVSECQKVCL